MRTTIKLHRIVLHMTKTELAHKARISKTYITKIERNLSFPSPIVLRRIARALNVCPYELIDFCTNCTFNCINKKS